MSYIPGQFSETILLQQQFRADAMMMDDRIKQQFIPKIDVYNYLRSLQNARLNTAFAGTKEYDVEIQWMNACDNFDRDDISCEIGGNEVSTNAKKYMLRKRIVKGFSVRDDVFRDNSFDAEEAIAKALLRIDKQIAEEFSQYLVGVLNANAGRNVVTDRYTVEDDRTDIPPDQWTSPLMAYFARAMIMNRFDSAAMITGANLFETLYTAEAMRANADGKGDPIMWGKLPIWFDLFNIDSVNSGASAHIAEGLFTYLVTQGSLAMVNKTWNPGAPSQNFHDIRYTMPSKFLSGFKYDVFYNNACLQHSGTATPAGFDFDRDWLNDNPTARNETFRSDTLQHNYKIVLTAEAFTNPYGCDMDYDDVDADEDRGDHGNTGILRFRNA